MKRRATDNISLRRLIWMACVVIGASLPHWPNLPFWIPLLLAASIAWRLGARLYGLPLPNRVLRLGLAIITFLVVLAQYRTVNGVNAGSALLVVMIALKFLESTSQRDQLVLIMISYFLVFAGLLYQSSFATGLYVVGFVWLTTIGLLQLGRQGDLMNNIPTAKLAAKLLFQATPIMIVLFLLFPRLPGPLWAIPGSSTSAVTGLSDSMSPGDITELGLSDEVAFRVDFKSGPPSADELYWRGPVLSHFNGRTWTRREGMWQRAESTLEHFGEPVRYRVMLEPHNRSWAYALDMPAEWSASNRQNIGMQSDYQLRIFLRNGPSSRFDYEVTSYTDYAAMEKLEEPQKAVYLDLPEGFNPRTRALVADWRADGLSPRELIARALNYFRDDDFFYTLTPPALGSHSVDDFVFETKEGFCEHYASTFAFMMRAAGIPTRVVTGYQGGELNSLGSYYIVRQSNAHAWTEVWLENEGWVRVDPIAAVAPERIALGSSSTALSGGIVPGSAFRRIGWVRKLALAWDAIQTNWNDWIINYGPQLQRSLLESLGIERPRWADMFAVAAGATAVCLALFAAYFAWTARRMTVSDPAERQFTRFMRRMRRLRVPPRSPTESPVAFATRASLTAPAYSAPIRRIVNAYLRARYEPDSDQRSLMELRRLVAEFRPGRHTAAPA